MRYICKLVVLLISTYTVLPFHHSCCSSHRSTRVLFSPALLEIYNRYTVVLIDIHDACEHNYRSYSGALVHEARLRSTMGK